MAPRGRTPKPYGQARNRTPLVHGWVEVPDTPCTGGPVLPPTRRNGKPLPDGIAETWAAWASMPHARLWGPSDWAFAMDTLEIAARVHDGGAIGWAAELRYREKVMGTTWDARRSAGIRYVPSAAADTPAGVVPLDSHRDL
jgi:hypothetical protein